MGVEGGSPVTGVGVRVWRGVTCHWCEGVRVWVWRGGSPVTGVMV